MGSSVNFFANPNPLVAPPPAELPGTEAIDVAGISRPQLPSPSPRVDMQRDIMEPAPVSAAEQREHVAVEEVQNLQQRGEKVMAVTSIIGAIIGFFFLPGSFILMACGVGYNLYCQRQALKQVAQSPDLSPESRYALGERTSWAQKVAGWGVPKVEAPQTMSAKVVDAIAEKKSWAESILAGGAVVGAAIGSLVPGVGPAMMLASAAGSAYAHHKADQFARASAQQLTDKESAILREPTTIGEYLGTLWPFGKDKADDVGETAVARAETKRAASRTEDPTRSDRPTVGIRRVRTPVQ